MNIKFVEAFLLLSVLLMLAFTAMILVPDFSFAADMSTDTTGEYLDDATICEQAQPSKAIWSVTVTSTSGNPSK